MNVLKGIEREERSRIWREARNLPHPPYLRAFLFAFVATPILIFESMFVALFGALLSLTVLMLCAAYLFVRRSFRLLLASFLGSSLSIAALVALTSRVEMDLHMPLAYLLAISTAATIFFIFFVAGTIVRLFDAATARLAQDTP